MVEFDDFEGEFAFVEHVGGEVFLGFELVDDRWGGLLLVMGGGLFLCKNLVLVRCFRICLSIIIVSIVLLITLNIFNILQFLLILFDHLLHILVIRISQKLLIKPLHHNFGPLIQLPSYIGDNLTSTCRAIRPSARL